jgi:uncharacterized protein YjiS (DUF1127 family)
MTLVTHMPPAAMSCIRRHAIAFARLRRLAKDWLAAAMIYRERRAAFYALYQYDDRELKDIGLTRGEIDETLKRTTRRRTRGGL